jgi:hypothetical protein
MSAVGNWTLHFSWGCTGSYSQSPITFNANGTFALAPYTGKWVQNEGKIIFKFDQAPNSVYGGDEVSNAMLGISSTFAGLNGCWYAIRTGSTSAPMAEAKPEFDAAGQKPK